MKAKLIYLITEDWFFCSHFIERAIAARSAGFDVAVVARVGRHGDAIRAAGLRLLPLKVERRGLNPLTELRTLLAIWRIYRAERPDLVHHIALKPIIYGSLSARMAGVRRIVNAPVGMGFVFTSKGLLARALRPLVAVALRGLLNPHGSRVVFENTDDLATLVASGFVRHADACLIRGAGVDLNRFRLSPEAVGVPIVTLTARMLWDKGIAEFVEAARQLQAAGVSARFQLVGAPDQGNPAAIPEAQLRAWEAEGVIEWLGSRDDIPDLLAASHVVCLPSYREGLPKSLLEALAAGRPVVTTDVPGCREVVRNHDNGLLVPVRDADALAAALHKLLNDKHLRTSCGSRGRARAEAEFASPLIIAQTLALYRTLGA